MAYDGAGGMKVLVLNSGSSSVKYQVLDTATRKPLVVGVVERIGAGGAILNQTRPSDGVRIRESAAVLDHRDAIRAILDLVKDPERGAVASLDEIEAVGHRVVHGGERFTETVRIDAEVVDGIRDCIGLAPLHNPHNLSGILAARERLSDVPHVAVFDTAFHAGMPPRAYHYAVPYVLYRRHRIRRYGFHGTSHAHVVARLAELCGKAEDVGGPGGGARPGGLAGEVSASPRTGFDPGADPPGGLAGGAASVSRTRTDPGADGPGAPGGGDLRIVSVHLGNGASACAVVGGRSVDTSMGFTPLEGLVMGTRSGDLDPAVVLHVMSREELTVSDATALLNKHSGLQGLSGLSSDMRDLLEEEADGNERARLALEVYTYRVRKYVGAYAAAMGGLDAVGFTGGVGQNSGLIRARCLEGLGFLGIRVDAERNEALTGGKEGVFQEADAPVTLAVVPSGEELVIALEAERLTGAGDVG